jgi:hypothetical protein
MLGLTKVVLFVSIKKENGWSGTRSARAVKIWGIEEWIRPAKDQRREIPVGRHNSSVRRRKLYMELT